MSETMGRIIRRLRKERNLTQEELAEQLNTSAPAISKWENDTGMPDISQVVPIAKIFGVSTDVLFGTFGESDDDEAMKIIRRAQEQTYDDGRSTTKRLYEGYLTVQEGLKRYPNNIMLLVFSLERGLALAYPENDCYDAGHAKSIYEESVRQANIVISYGKNAADVLRAHMIMVMLHSAYGNVSQAAEHSYQFPCRADMTVNNMSAFIAHSEGDCARELESRKCDFVHLLEAMLDSMALSGQALYMCGRYADAITVYTAAFALIKTVFCDEKYIPPVHERDCGDMYALLAKAYIKSGDKSGALLWLEKMVNYDFETRARFTDGMQIRMPLLHQVPFISYYKNTVSRKGRMELLASKLNDGAFECLKDDEKFKSLINACRTS